MQFIDRTKVIVKAGENVTVAIDFHVDEGTYNNENGVESLILDTAIPTDAPKTKDVRILLM